jgi:hypothetical protein
MKAAMVIEYSQLFVILILKPGSVQSKEQMFEDCAKQWAILPSFAVVVSGDEAK